MERLTGRELDAAIAELRGWKRFSTHSDGKWYYLRPPHWPQNHFPAQYPCQEDARPYPDAFDFVPCCHSDPAAALELLAWMAQQDWYMQARIWGPNTNHDKRCGEFACAIKWNAGPVLLDANGDADTLPAAIAQAVYAALSARQGAREEE